MRERRGGGGGGGEREGEIVSKVLTHLQRHIFNIMHTYSSVLLLDSTGC